MAAVAIPAFILMPVQKQIQICYNHSMNIEIAKVSAIFKQYGFLPKSTIYETILIGTAHKEAVQLAFKTLKLEMINHLKTNLKAEATSRSKKLLSALKKIECDLSILKKLEPDSTFHNDLLNHWKSDAAQHGQLADCDCSLA